MAMSSLWTSVVFTHCARLFIATIGFILAIVASAVVASDTVTSSTLSVSPFP